MLKSMKILFVLLLISGTSIAQNYQNQILANQQGYQYTEAHFQTGLQFAEFLLNQPLSYLEQQNGRQEALQSFMQNPAAVLEEVNQVYNVLQQLYATTDPAQVALFRSAVLCQLYVTVHQTGERPYLWQLIETYSSVLAYDTDNMLVLTQKDVEGYLTLMQFYAQLSGQQVYFDLNTQNQLAQEMVQAFLQGTLEDRQTLAVMALMDDYMQGVYAQMNMDQQQDFTASYVTANSGGTINYNNTDELWPAGVNTRAEKQAYLIQKQAEMDANNFNMGIMQDMMTQSHVTSMNIIENMGDSGNYWEVTYDDY